MCKYLLYAIEHRRYDGTWPQKAQYAFFVDFIAEVLRFAAYVVFFSIVFAYYGVPLHIVRELWASYVQLRQRLQAFKKYRALTANMDERFPPERAVQTRAPPVEGGAWGSSVAKLCSRRRSAAASTSSRRCAGCVAAGSCGAAGCAASGCRGAAHPAPGCGCSTGACGCGAGAGASTGMSWRHVGH